MANKLQWVLEMVDKVSGPTKSARGSLGDFIQTTHSALAAVQLIGQAAVGAGRMIASGLEPAISREKSLGAFETLLGTAEQARSMYGQAVKFAAETPFETAQVVDAFQRLLTAKFSEEEVPIALRIIGDAASMQQDSQAAVASVTRALSQIRSKGKLQGEELMQLQEAVPINTAALYEKLGKLYGVNAQRARKMVSDGQIDSQAASFAILEQLSEQFGGNMKRASTQVEGLLSTLRSRPSEILSQLQDQKGYKVFGEAIKNVVKRFDESTPAGQRFQEMVNEIGSGALERVAVLLDYVSEGAVSFVDGLSEGLGPMDESFGPANQTNLEKFKLLMDGLGQSVGKLAGYAGQVSDLFAKFYDFGNWLDSHPWVARLVYIGGGALAGSTVGPIGTIAGAIAGGSAYATMREESTPGAVGPGETPYRGVTEARANEQMYEALLASAGYGMSPEDYADAYDLPRYAAGGIVRRPTVALIGEAGPEAVVPLQGRSGGRTGAGSQSLVVNAPISLTFAGPASASDARSIADTVGPAVEAHLYSVLERLALQSGRYANG